LQIAASASVSDPDAIDLGGGNLLVQVTTGASAYDRVAIRKTNSLTPNAAGQLLLNSQVIGSFSGGTGTTPLMVNFNALVTPSVAGIVLRNIVYHNVSRNPTPDRTVTVWLGDGAGGSASLTKEIHVSAVNDAPILSGGGAISYVHDTAAILLLPFGGLSDSDSANFSGGRLRVRITDGASSSNRLSIGGGFTLDSSNNVLLAGVIIGRRVANGFGTNELVVTFTNAATQNVVRQLIRSITFKTVGGTAVQRKVVFTVSDGDGGLSNECAKVVNVT
jgi:hypothetical protein